MMQGICARERIRARAAAGCVTVEVRLPAGWAPWWTGAAHDAAALLDDLRDLCAELDGYCADVQRTETAADDDRADYRQYRAMSGYGNAVGIASR